MRGRIVQPRKVVYDDAATVGTPENPSNEIVTAANVITMARLVLTFVFLWVFVQGENRILAITLYGIAASTDWIDGILARTTNTVTWLGKVLDPIVDRALLFTGVIGLAFRGELPAWVAVIVVLRDAWLAGGALVLQKKYRKKPVDVIYLGKTTTALLMTGFALMLLGQPVLDGFGIFDISWLPLLNSEPASVGILFVYAGVPFSIATAVVYTWQAYHYYLASKAAGERL